MVKLLSSITLIVRRKHTKTLLKSLLPIVTICVLANIGMAILYHNRALPNYFVGQQPVGGQRFSDLNVTVAKVLPAKVTLQKSNTKVQETPGDLGISVDRAASLQALRKTRSWVPLMSLIMHHHVALQLHVDSVQAARAAATLANSFAYPAEGPHVAFNGSAFVQAPAHNGYQLNTGALLPAVTTALQQGETHLTVPIQTLKPPASSTDLSGQIKELQSELATNISLMYQSKRIQPSQSDIGNWYVASGTSMVASEAKAADYVNNVGQQLGITVANPNDLATAMVYAVSKKESLSFSVTPKTSSLIVRTYCTNVNGVSDSLLTDLTGKLAATYNDARGWNDGGRIAFEHVASGCQYTVWLTAASQMTTFGAICDDYYNCQVGTNVVLNDDRWVQTTQPWLAKTNGSVEDYRTLMIDHETGHRLGFLDNPTCPGTGQPAPVMMQQSIDLKGCFFNIWPLTTEFTQLAHMLDLGQTTSVTNLQ